MDIFCVHNSHTYHLCVNLKQGGGDDSAEGLVSFIGFSCVFIVKGDEISHIDIFFIQRFVDISKDSFQGLF